MFFFPLFGKELQSLVPRYEAAVSETIDAYLVKLRNWQSSADDLIELLDPLDHERIRTLEEIVRLRHAMRELLNANQWNQVFKLRNSARLNSRLALTRRPGPQCPGKAGAPIERFAFPGALLESLQISPPAGVQLQLNTGQWPPVIAQHDGLFVGAIDG